MPEEPSPLPIGSVGWMDLTVEDAPRIRDFYEQVVGWTHQSVEMGAYQDFCLQEPATGKNVAGVCHARGVNRDLPAGWLIYIVVADLEASIQRCTELGGKVIRAPVAYGAQARFCVIQDPSGAACALHR